MKNPKKVYEKRVNNYSELHIKLSKTMNIISTLRLVIAGIIIFNIVLLLRGKGNTISSAIVLVSIVLFMYILSYHNKLRNTYKYVDILKNINLKSIDKLEGKWRKFDDTGSEFIDESHKFSHDLDIFGKGSLFQMINTCNTHMGRTRLAEILTNPLNKRESIQKRQEAVKELSSKRWLRQRIQAEGMIKKNKDKENDINGLIKWSKSRNENYNKPLIILIIRLLPIITISSLVLLITTKVISYKIPLLLIVIQFLMTFFNKTINTEFALVYKYRNSIKRYTKILEHFEKNNFKSEYLNNLKSKLTNDEGVTAIKQLRKLDTIVENTLHRKNAMFLPIAILIIWDYQCMIALERWKSECGKMINDWIFVIGEIEALCSLGTIGYDNPDWVIPKIVDEPSVLKGKSIGHPLLTNKRVCNDISISEPSRILLITGSNMSGKSTLLRTIGINLVLGYIGAPVCAKEIKCSLMNIHTCMRISDNLEEGVSSFYGELKRIKKIVEASNKKEQVFFLLDEIFKGTNSYDRHIGAKTLLKQLYNNEGVGLVSTHDLELGELEDESNGNIKNYHFLEHYKNNEIYFDYKLRKGISTTRNALYLIKMSGIEVQDI